MWKQKSMSNCEKHLLGYALFEFCFSNFDCNVQYTTFPLIEWWIRISLITLVAATTTEYHWFKNRVIELMIFYHDHWFSRLTRTKRSWKSKNQWPILKNICWFMHYFNSVSVIYTVMYNTWHFPLIEWLIRISLITLVARLLPIITDSKIA